MPSPCADRDLRKLIEIQYLKEGGLGLRVGGEQRNQQKDRDDSQRFEPG
jgi:hypothetical protein